MAIRLHRMGMSKRKPPTIGKLRVKLWRILSRYIRVKYSSDGVNVPCYTCGNNTVIGTSDSQGGHYWAKGGYEALRFDERNIRNQCYRCNEIREGETQIFGMNLLKEIGQEELDDMFNMRKDVCKRSRAWYLEKIDEYKTKLYELENLHGVDHYKI